MDTQRTSRRYRLILNKAQEEQLEAFANARRFVWNWAIATRREAYTQRGETVSVATLCGLLKAYKQTHIWLKAADSQALQQAIRDVDAAYQRFFHKQGGFPKFRSRKRDVPRFRIPQRVSIERGYVVVPKIGCIKVKQHRPVDGTTKSATFKRDAVGHWYVTFVVEQVVAPMKPVEIVTAVGVDVGLNDFAVTSEGAHIANPRLYRKAERRLAKAQCALSRKQRGSSNREKARLAVAKLHLKVVNQRQDFVHKLSTQLVANYDLIAVEDLNVKGLAKTKLSKSVHDASWSTFRTFLGYKVEHAGKHLAVISRWFPSSKLCGVCGAVKDSLTLSERMWTCACGAVHNRDENAANNIKIEGLRSVGLGF